MWRLADIALGAQRGIGLPGFSAKGIGPSRPEVAANDNPAEAGLPETWRH
jgi:hypothetical protein